MNLQKTVHRGWDCLGSSKIHPEMSQGQVFPQKNTLKFIPYIFGGGPKIHEGLTAGAKLTTQAPQWI